MKKPTLAALQAKIDALTGQVDEWRNRAYKAENALEKDSYGKSLISIAKEDQYNSRFEGMYNGFKEATELFLMTEEERKIRAENIAKSYRGRVSDSY